MSAPILIDHDTTGALTSGLTWMFDITSSRAGDYFIFYTMSDTNDVVGYEPIPDVGAPTINFALINQNTYPAMSIYTGFGATDASNYQIETGLTGGTPGAWATGFVQIRNAAEGPSFNTNTDTANPVTVDLASTTGESGTLVIVNDAFGTPAADGNWNSTDGYDPETGGTVLLKDGVNGVLGCHVAYFPNIGPAGNYTYSLSSSGLLSVYMLAMEIEPSMPNSGFVPWISA